MKRVCNNCKSINEYDRHYCENCGHNLTICMELSNFTLIISRLFGLISAFIFIYLFGVLLIDIINRTGFHGIFRNLNMIIIFILSLIVSIIMKKVTNNISKKNKDKEVYNEKLSEEFLIKENKYKLVSKILFGITVLSLILVLVYNKAILITYVKENIMTLHADALIIILCIVLFFASLIRYSYISLILLTIVIVYFIITYIYKINFTIKYSKLDTNLKKILYFFINVILVLIFFILIYYEIKNVIIPLSQTSIIGTVK